MPKRPIFLVFILLLVSSISAQSTEGRIALVIGNGNYSELAKLKNPANDATDMATALKGLGFNVDLLVDVDLVAMEDAVIRLGSRLSSSPSSIGFFFYSGHGVQSNGINYLIPADAHMPSESFLKTKALAAQEVLDVLESAKNVLNIVVLDACRDNPFGWARSGSRGLTMVGTQPPGSIVVYATSAGSVARDGSGRNGIFTGALLENLATPGLEVGEIFKRTGASVQAATMGEQNPAVYSQFFKSAYLSPEQGTSLAASRQEDVSAAKPADLSSAQNPPASGSVLKYPSKDSSVQISDRISLMLFDKDYLDRSKQEDIRILSGSLTDNEKRSLFNKYKYRGFWPALGNTFLGAGSWLQGDYWGAAAISGSWAVGGLLMTISPAVNGNRTTLGNIGAAIAAFGLVAGWIRPFTFAAGRNQQLAVAIQYAD